MGTSFVAVTACCPLCGSSVLSVSGAGRVLSEEGHPIALTGDRARGYMLCDDCGMLADLPTDLTLN
ncbi:MAG: hypothetical protein DMF79_01950 [Acidobacteria bacterium]|nr:MAG: hypothetical protein DMF79_01950 [Acidobacteriota bacterium]